MSKYVLTIWPLLAAIFLAAFTKSCTDPTSLGANLLEEDRLGLDYVDTFSLSAIVVPNDSILVYSGTSLAGILSSNPFGKYNDPVFGKVEAGIYVQPNLQLSAFGSVLSLTRPDFKEVILDSIVLVLTLDSAGFYGLPTENFGLEVYRVLEDIDRGKNHYSNASFATESTPLGSLEFAPRLDSLRVIDYGLGTSDTLRFPHLRIPINPAFGQELISLDTINFTNDSTFLLAVKGLYIKPTLTTSSMVAFNWRTIRPGLYVYYSNSQGQPAQYKFEFNQLSARISTYKHDFSGAPIASFLGNAEASDTLMLAHGLAGADVRIDIPFADELRNAIINYAELEIPLGFFPNDDTLRYKPASDLLLFTLNSSGGLEPISDVLFSGNQRAALFGGVRTARENGKPDVYRLNISSQLAEMANGRAPKAIFLRLLTKAQNTSRVTLLGPGHPQHRMRLRVAFTKR
jgi:hypothetical protein